MFKKLLFCCFFFLLVNNTFAFPSQVNIQLLAKDISTGLFLDANKVVVAKVYDSNVGGNIVFEETQTVEFVSGLGNFVLGDQNNLTNTIFDANRFLGITVAGDSSERTPRIKFLAVPYAFIAESFSDDNKAGRFNSGVIANAPWLTVAPADTNWQTSFSLFDANMALNYYKQIDANNIFVPYQGAIADVNLGTHDLNANKIYLWTKGIFENGDKGGLIVDGREPTDPHNTLNAITNSVNVISNYNDAWFGYKWYLDNEVNADETLYPNVGYFAYEDQYGSISWRRTDNNYDGKVQHYYNPFISSDGKTTVTIGIGAESQMVPTVSTISYYGKGTMSGQMGGLGTVGMVYNPITFGTDDGDFSGDQSGTGASFSFGIGGVPASVFSTMYEQHAEPSGSVSDARIEIQSLRNGALTPLTYFSGDTGNQTQIGSLNIIGNTEGSEMVSDEDFTGGGSTWTFGTKFAMGYEFTVSSVQMTIVPTEGATYTNNGITYTIVGAITTADPWSFYPTTVYSGKVYATGSGAPTANGDLTKVSGTGDATITFDSVIPMAIKNTDGGGTLQQTAGNMLANTVAGNWYKLTLTLVPIAETTGANAYNEKVTPTVGGTQLLQRGVTTYDGTKTYVEYFQAIDANGIVFTPKTTNNHFGISLVSVKEITGGDVNANKITALGDINATKDVYIAGTLYGGSPLDVGSDVNMHDNNITDIKILKAGQQYVTTIGNDTGYSNIEWWNQNQLIANGGDPIYSNIAKARLNQKQEGQTVWSANIDDQDAIDATETYAFKMEMDIAGGNFNFQGSLPNAGWEYSVPMKLSANGNVYLNFPDGGGALGRTIIGTDQDNGTGQLQVTGDVNVIGGVQATNFYGTSIIFPNIGGDSLIIDNQGIRKDDGGGNTISISFPSTQVTYSPTYSFPYLTENAEILLDKTGIKLDQTTPQTMTGLGDGFLKLTSGVIGTSASSVSAPLTIGTDPSSIVILADGSYSVYGKTTSSNDKEFYLNDVSNNRGATFISGANYVWLLDSASSYGINTSLPIIASSFSDGTATLTGGALTGLTSFSASSLSDGTCTITGGALSGCTGLVTSETDPVVGAITGVPKGDGAGNISGATLDDLADGSTRFAIPTALTLDNLPDGGTYARPTAAQIAAWDAYEARIAALENWSCS